jgi:DNA-binding response OmpR family regulator
MGLLGEILVVDDERAVRSAFKALFESEGYTVLLAKDGDEAVKIFLERRPSLVLMDIMMPKKNGIAACSEIRAADPLVPILSFTAMPSDMAMLRTLGSGADDYIPKDRPPEEFLARVNAAVRKAEKVKSLIPDGADLLKIGSLVIDFTAMKVTAEGQTHSLTKSERILLKLLLTSKGRCFSFTEIFTALRGEGYIGDDAAIRNMVSRLKQKLGREGHRIESVRSYGYRFTE